MPARVIGIGQPLGGDDAVGLEVVRALRSCDEAADAELVESTEPAELIGLVTGADPVVLVDALVTNGMPGRVSVLSPEDLGAVRPFSTHGLGIGEVIGLARTIEPERVARRIVLVGVTIHRPGGTGEHLSAEVAAAVPEAAAEVVRLLGSGPLRA